MIAKAFASLLASGGVLLCSNYMGKNDEKKTNRIYTTVLMYCLIFGVICSFVLLPGSSFLLKLTGLKPETQLFQSSRDYLIGRGIGVVPYMLTVVLMWFLKIQDGKKINIAATVVMSVSNVMLDLLFPVVFDLGMFGVGLATAISYVLALLVCLTFFISKKNVFRLTKVEKPFESLKQVADYGFMTAVFRLCSAAGVYILNCIFLNEIGKEAVLGYTIWTNLIDFIGIGIYCTGQSLSPMIALFAGEEDKHAIASGLKYAVRFGLKIAAALMIVTFVFAAPIAYLFGITKVSYGYQTVINAIRTFAVFLIPNVFVMVGINYYNSIRRPFVSNMMLVMNKLVLISLTALLFAKLFPDNVWCAFVITEVLTTAAVLVYLSSCLHRFPTFDDICFYKTDIGAPEDMVCEATIGNSTDEVVENSRKLQAFCLTHGISERSSYYVSLAVEEMAENIVNYSYEPGEKHYLDIRIVMKNDKLFVCIRNDGKQFDTVNYYKSLNSDDVFSNIGIRMIMKTAVDVRYHYVLGMNHLLIQVQ